VKYAVHFISQPPETLHVVPSLRFRNVLHGGFLLPKPPLHSLRVISDPAQVFACQMPCTLSLGAI
jgi:hypothetical protein